MLLLFTFRLLSLGLTSFYDAFRASAKLDREQRPMAPTTPTPTSPLAPSAARPIIKSSSHLIAHTPARARISPKVRARSPVAHKTHQSKSRSCARDNTQRAEPPDFFFPGLPRRRAATRTPSPSLKDAGPQQRQQGDIAARSQPRETQIGAPCSKILARFQQI